MTALTLPRPARRAGLVILAVAVTAVLASLGVQYGWRVPVIAADLVAVPCALWWAARRYPQLVAIAVLTTATCVALVAVSGSRWAGVDPGLMVMTPVAFALAAPAGTVVVRARRGQRTVTVALVDVALLAVAAVGPAAPSFLPVLALLALTGPLVWQGWRR